jgi:hypothetical protein
MADLTQAMDPRKTPEGREAARKRVVARGNPEMISTVGVILPTTPSTAEELIDLWKIPSALTGSVSVHIQRQVLGTKDFELIESSVPVTRYSMAGIAANYGPGNYYVRGSKNPWLGKAAKIVISEEYAATQRAERQTVQPPSVMDQAREVVVSRGIQQVSGAAGMDPAQFVDLVSRILDERDRAKAAANPPVDPLAGMKSLREQMAVMFEFQEMARKMGQGQAPIAEDAEARPWWADLARELAPVVAPLVQGLVNRSPSPVAVPARPMTYAPTSQPIAKPAEDIIVNGTEKKTERILLIPEEHRDSVMLGVTMLKPFAPFLISKNDGKRNEYDLAVDLVGWIPDDAAQATMDLAVAAKMSPDILGLIHEKMAGSPFWVAVLQEIQKLLIEKYGSDDDAAQD